MASHCLDDAILDRLVAGELDPDELARVDEHVDTCAACRDRVIARARRAESIASRAPSMPVTRSDAPPSRRREIEPAPDPYVGSLLEGRYHVVRKIGGGGMGTVYEAEHVLIGRRVAIKVLHPQFAASSEIVRRFQNEARAAGTLGHPGILQALDMGRTDAGAPFLVLEYLEGRDLEDEIAAIGRVPIARAIDLACRIADALATAHAAGVVHRDLKPNNVFLTTDGGVKILDFGISKISSSLATGPATAPGALMGTPAYMAPEQFEDAGSATPRSDVYALGVILYRMLSGALPYEAGSLQGILIKIIQGDAPSLRSVRSDVPEELDAVVKKAMSPKPDDRFGGMPELAEALRAFASVPSAITRVPGDRKDERRVATVLVARDIADADRARAIVEEAGGRRASDHEGALVAVFGERTWHGDEPLRAVRAGLALRRIAGATAVASGHVERTGDAVRGDALERALEACLASLDGVAVVQPSARIEATFAVRRVTDELAEVTAETPSWSMLPPLVPEAQPLLGRDGEIAQLRVAIDRATSEHTPVVAFVTGGPGMGKSRLAAEVVRLCEAASSRPTLLVARASSARTEQLGLIADAITARGRWAHRALGAPRIDADAPVEERRDAVRRLAEEAAGATPEAASLAEFLGELLGVSMPASSTLRAALADPRLMRDRLVLALRDYLDGLTARGPVAIVLEDLQWADAESIALVEQLVSDVAWDRPLFVTGTARAESLGEVPAPFDGPDVIDLKLRPIGVTDVQALAAWLTGREITETVARALLDHTGGNPLFVEHTLRALAEDGRTVEGDDPTSLPLPIDVEAAVQARLDALPDAQREAMKRAAVLGGPFTPSDLAALGASDVAASLDGLGRAGLVRRRPGRTGGEAVYEVRTPLVADVVYRVLTDEARTALHLAAARFLSARADADDEAVALHFDRGGAGADAVRRYHAAALAAARRQDTRKVRRCAERALAIGAPEDARYSLFMLVSDALEAEGRLDEQRRALDEALRAAASAEERASAMTADGIWTLRVRGAAASVPVFERAVAEAQKQSDAATLARALGRYATALVYVGRLGEAAGVLGEVDRIVVTRAFDVRVDLAVWRAQLAGAQGDLGARRNAYMTAVELYRALGDQRSEAGASVNLADALNRFGAHAEAEEALTRAHAQCRRLRMGLMEGYALVNRAYARLVQGALDGARADLDAALSVAASTGDHRLALFARLYVAKLALASGDVSGAERLAHEVAGAASELGVGPARALARVIAGRALLASGDAAGALACTTDAMAIRAELGGLEEDEGEVFLAHVEALEANERSDEAARVRDEAKRTLTATAQRIGDPVWRARFLEAVPAHRALAS